MPKINQEEYEVLKNLDDKWEWIARDEAQQTYAYEYRPIKSKLRGQWESNWIDYYLLPHDGLQFIQWEDEEPYSIAELIEEYEKESEETEVKNIEWLTEEIGELPCVDTVFNSGGLSYMDSAVPVMSVYDLINELDKSEPKNITLHDVADKLWELPLNNRKLWLARLNNEFQEGYIVPLGLKTTDGEEQYLTYNGSYFASRRNRHLQQTFATLEEIPEFYRDLAERVL